MKLRLGGATLRDIAKALPEWAEREGIPLSLKYDWRSVYMDIEREMCKVDNQTKEVKDQMLSINLDRLDYMFQGLWKDAVNGNEHKVDRILKILDRQSRYLGLDAPVRTELSGDLSLTVKDLHELLAEDVGTEDQGEINDSIDEVQE